MKISTFLNNKGKNEILKKSIVKKWIRNNKDLLFGDISLFINSLFVAFTLLNEKSLKIHRKKLCFYCLKFIFFIDSRSEQKNLLISFFLLIL